MDAAAANRLGQRQRCSAPATAQPPSRYALQRPEGLTMTLTHKPEIGEVLVDMALTALDGRTVRLSEYRGRRLLIFMWASW